MTLQGRLSALILAGGLSSRMHRYKPLLPLGKEPMAVLAIKGFAAIGITDIIAVTGHHHDRLAPVVSAAGARPVFNPDFIKGMFSSVRTGVAAIPACARGFFLLPVDIPLVRPQTLDCLARAFDRDPDRIVMPEFDGTPGHPPIIPSNRIPDICSAPEQGNLRQVLFDRPGQIQTVAVHDRGVLMDADTPSAYEALKARFSTRNIPDRAECRSMVNAALPGQTAIHRHMDLVGEVAAALARAVNQPGAKDPAPAPGLDSDLIRAAALVHDIRRPEKNHAAKGSAYLRELGFPDVARLVASHMTLETPDPFSPLAEAEILFLADKLCRGDRLDINYRERFTEKLRDHPEWEKGITQRYETARHIQKRVETAAGLPLAQILGRVRG